jgi:hypothetical protein
MDIEKNGGKKENIFDLTKLAPNEIQQEVDSTVKKISPDEQVSLLKNYQILPTNEWDNLVSGDHIRYLRKDGSFRRGGYFKGSWVSKNTKNLGKKFIQLSTSPTFNFKTWTITFGDIEKIYIKKNRQINQQTNNQQTNNQQTNNQPQTINAQNENIEYLIKTVDQLKIDMIKASNEQTRIINLIKKLHGISSNK